jgi:hypothetical protein
MGKKKNPVSKFMKGDKVTVSIIAQEPNDKRVFTIAGPPKWNGFTWMYAFDEMEMRCGENYVNKVGENPETQPEEMTFVESLGNSTKVQITDEQCKEIIDNLDEIASDYDPYEYGLPQNPEQVKLMIERIKSILNK